MRKANSTHSRQSKMNQHPFEFLLLFLLQGRSRQRENAQSEFPSIDYIQTQTLQLTLLIFASNQKE
jgi:hypothetical protein